MIRIFSIDPGKTSGFCILEVKDGKPLAVLSGEGELFYPVALLDDLVNHRSEPITHIVYEEFLANPLTLGVLRQRDALLPLEVIGALKFTLEDKNIEIPCRGFPAAQRKFFTDERLKALGCYYKGDHARDAIRHALAFAAFQLKALDLSPLV